MRRVPLCASFRPLIGYYSSNSKYQDPSGAFKVQVYSPYIFLNKSGLPLQIRSKTWMGQPRDIAGGSALKDDHLRERPTPISEFPPSA